MHFKLKALKFILTHTFLVLVTVGLGHGVYSKLYTVIGGQRAEKFENHWCKQMQIAGKSQCPANQLFLCLRCLVHEVLQFHATSNPPRFR